MSILNKHKIYKNIYFMHRLGIEPRAIAWKANMLPLHQRCNDVNIKNI